MKLRNFIIVLFALLVAFAFASCKHEPKVDPTPAQTKIEHPIYQIVVDEGVEKDYYNRDKIKLRWTDVEVNEGSVITLKYRSERGIYQWDIRDEGAGVKWVYETDKNGFVDPVKGEDGWYTLTYTLGKDIKGEDFDYPNDAIAVYFRGRYAAGDVFEIKDITLDGKTLEVAPATVISKAHLEGEGAIEDHEWTIPENYVYLLAMGALGSVDKNPIIAKVAPNAAIDLSKIPERENYKIHIYSDSAFANELEETAPVTADATIVYYKYVGDPRLVTIDLNEGTADPAIENITAEYGSPIAEPETIPTVTGGNLFAGWYKDLTDEAPYDFSTPVTEAFTLHAKYTAPVTVHFNTGDGDAMDDKIIATGTAVAQPEDATYPANLYMFAGWFADADCKTPYDFSTIITAETTIYAKWIDAKRVTFNLNYEGAPEAKVIGVDTGTAAKEPTEVPMRAGWVFDGWYTEAGCTNKYNFATLVNADTPLFAKWTQGTIYRITSGSYTDGYDADKFILSFPNAGVKPGDIISLTYRETEPFTKWSIRRFSDNKKFFHEKASGDYPLFFSSKTTADGWTTVTYEFPAEGAATQDAAAATYPKDAEDETKLLGVGFNMYFLNSKMVPGAIMEVKAVTINGVEQTLTKDNFGPRDLGRVDQTIEVVPADYDWTAQTVSFNTDGGSEIGDASVDFGKSVAKPADPTKTDFAFAGWYADAELTKAFDFGVAITKATTIYAKWVPTVTLTFNSQEGSAVAAITAGIGLPIEEPEDPTRLGYVFAGWFEEAGCTTPFDFTKGISADKTVYAKWLAAKAITLDPNYVSAPAATVVYAETGTVISAPSGFGRAGYFFSGWYDDAGCTVAHDFTAAVNADITLYAKWVEPTKEYKYTVTDMAGDPNDRIQFRFKSGSSYAPILADLKAGDTITLMVRSTANVAKIRVRTVTGSKNVFYYYTIPGAAANTWLPVTLDITSDYLACGGITIAFYNADTSAGVFTEGDTFEIKAFAINGVEIPIRTDSTSCGLYESHSDTDHFWYGVPASVQALDL